jgi:hypothetical protein
MATVTRSACPAGRWLQIVLSALTCGAVLGTAPEGRWNGGLPGFATKAIP